MQFDIDASYEEIVFLCLQHGYNQTESEAIANQILYYRSI